VEMSEEPEAVDLVVEGEVVAVEEEEETSPTISQINFFLLG
jgi:hypothetical protein